MEKLRNREIFMLLWLMPEYNKRNHLDRNYGICTRLSDLVQQSIITIDEHDEFFKYLRNFVINVRNSNNSDFIDLLIIENIEHRDKYWFESEYDRQLFLERLINLKDGLISIEVSDRFTISVIQIYYNKFKDIPRNIKGICVILGEIRNKFRLNISVHLEYNHIFKIVNRLSFIEKLYLGFYIFAIFNPGAGYLTAPGNHDKRRKLISYMLNNKKRIFKK